MARYEGDLVVIPRELASSIIATLCGPDGSPELVFEVQRHLALRPSPGSTPAEVERAALERAIDRMGWPEIRAFHAELDRGQDVHEDAGGFMMRAVRALFGLPSPKVAVETYQAAARAMIRRAA